MYTLSILFLFESIRDICVWFLSDHIYHCLLHVSYRIQNIDLRPWSPYRIIQGAKPSTVTINRFWSNVTLCYIEMSCSREWTESSIIGCFLFEESEWEFVRKFIKLKLALRGKGSTLNLILISESCKWNLFIARNQIKNQHQKSVVLGSDSLVDGVVLIDNSCYLWQLACFK